MALWVGLVGPAHATAFGEERPAPPELVRVEDPDAPGALARSSTGALLASPPADGTSWSTETLAVVDGVPAVEALEALNADLWHGAGHRGQGVRVAVLDIQWFGAERDAADLDVVATADCWTHASCETPVDSLEARFGYEQGVHGFACAEIVQDVAPDAELFLVRVNGFTTFENAADWAIRNDIDILSMSMSFYNTSFYDGTGSFAPVLERLAANDVLLVTSAGNNAQSHWSGPFVDADGDDVLDFDGTGRLPLRFSAGRRAVLISWDEHDACGLSDLDAYLYDADGDLVGRSEAVQDRDADRCSPVERLNGEIATTGVYDLEIVSRRDVRTSLEVDVLATGGSVVDPVVFDSLNDPAAHPLAFAVGAVRVDRYLTAGAEGFSARGPGRAWLRKPDLAGPNGLTAEPYGARGFFGTSASTPAVAGAIALVMSEDPSLSPYEAADRLRAWALSDDPTGWDPHLGAGRARLPDLDAAGLGCGRGAAALPWPALLLVGLRRRQRSARSAAAARPPETIAP